MDFKEIRGKLASLDNKPRVYRRYSQDELLAAARSYNEAPAEEYVAQLMTNLTAAFTDQELNDLATLLAYQGRNELIKTFRRSSEPEDSRIGVFLRRLGVSSLAQPAAEALVIIGALNANLPATQVADNAVKLITSASAEPAPTSAVVSKPKESESALSWVVGMLGELGTQIIDTAAKQFLGGTSYNADGKGFLDVESIPQLPKGKEVRHEG